MPDGKSSNEKDVYHNLVNQSGMSMEVEKLLEIIKMGIELKVGEEICEIDLNNFEHD